MSLNSDQECNGTTFALSGGFRTQLTDCEYHQAPNLFGLKGN